MKLLLHTCCAPCLIYPLKVLNQEGFKTQGFFYNPNIHPYSEYTKRYNAVMDYAKEAQLALVSLDKGYPVEDYFREVAFKEDKPARCHTCWMLRLRETARTAKNKNFDYFSTTLLVSPYQDQEILKAIGMQIQDEMGIKFFYRDFREGFREAHNSARSKGIYTQKYCGCIYSERERYAKCC